MEEMMEMLIENLMEKFNDEGFDEVDTCEAGRVIDMIKDLAMAKYYCTVYKAMEEGKQLPTLLVQ